MATKKAASKAAPKKKDTLVKIAETIGEVAGRISVKKDQLADKASHAVDAIKDGVHNIVEKEKKMVQKLTGKAPKKAAAKKAAPKKAAPKRPAPKKATSKKAAPKKAAKPGGALLHKALHKKTAAEKVAKKASPKKSAGKK